MPTLAQDSPSKPLFTVEGISEHRLPNGLRVLLFPDPSKSTVTVNVTYLVGSRHEGLGEKGMAHLLEHMLFKGTARFANVWGVLEDHGARFNGTTSFDRTNYFETLPATDENLDFALELEAERMVSSTIAAEELQKEFSVVRNEFEMGENDPLGVLLERIQSAAYLWHSYGCSTIGNRSDIERVPVASLRRFYETYYQPDNALLVVAGRFEPARALERIHASFGRIPRPARRLEPTYTVEPVQDGARYVELERVGSVQAAAAAWHACAGPHPDAPALAVLARILAAEPAGRLYQALIPTGRATRVAAYFRNLAEPGLFLTQVETRPGEDIRAVHDTLVGLVEGLAAARIRPEELERARTALLNQIKLVLADSTRIGIQLSEWQAQGDWRLFFLHRDRLKALELADVERVAARYFLATNRTSGVFRPIAEAPARAVVPETPDVAELVGRYAGSETIAGGEDFAATPETLERRTVRLALAPGIRLALLEKRARGNQVHARLRLHFGSETALNGRQGPLELLPELLQRGSRRLDHQALRDELDRLSSRLHLAVDDGRLEATIQSERDSVAAVIALLGELLRAPALAESELEIVRKERLASLEEGLTDPRVLAVRAAMRCLRPFPPESYHHVPTLEQDIERTRAATRAEIAALQARFLGAAHAEAVLIGDFDPGAVRAALERAFGDWRAAEPYARIARPFRPAEPARAAIATPDKEMAIVSTGLAFRLRDDEPDFAAVELANYALGQSAKSRLLNRLRHAGGMSYGAGSSLEVGALDDAASLSCYAICAPENSRKAQDAVREELERWLAEGLAPAELAEAKQGYRAKFQGALGDDRWVAERLLDGLELDRTLAFHADLVARIESLEPPEVLRALQARLAGLPRFEIVAGDAAKMAAD
jgi:zinc protease